MTKKGVVSPKAWLASSKTFARITPLHKQVHVYMYLESPTSWISWEFVKCNQFHSIRLGRVDLSLVSFEKVNNSNNIADYMSINACMVYVCTTNKINIMFQSFRVCNFIASFHTICNIVIHIRATTFTAYTCIYITDIHI